MKFCIVSDSHGDTIELLGVYHFAIEQKANFFIHLGDNATDAAILPPSSMNLISVPGTRDIGYGKPDRTCRSLEVENWNISLSHRIEDACKHCNIILHGHTHVPTLELHQGAILINPGHVINNTMRYPISTFAFLSFKNKEILANLYRARDFSLLEEKVFSA